MKTLNRIWLLAGIILGVAAVLSGGCKNDEEEGMPPALTAPSIYKITDNSAMCDYTVKDDAGGTVTERGLCFANCANPTTTCNKVSNGSGTGDCTCCLENLLPNTTYHVRAFATTENGTGYGWDVSFTTPPLVKDIEGHTYHTVIIGDQTWMAENLRVTHYRNGQIIPRIDDNTDWKNSTSGAYCLANNGDVFYNGYAATAAQNLAPEGWHVATDADWKVLEGTVDSQYEVGDAEWDKIMERGKDAGGNLKKTEGWTGPNTGANNSYLFSAVPSGWRWDHGEIAPGGGQASFWTSTKVSDITSWARCLFYDDARVHRNYFANTYGGNVRCVKD